jgi:outer membrane receptor protein involved in Fe transport
MSEQRLLFLHDGDRMLSATDISGVLSTVDMESLERIEVIKGAGSVMYGTGAMGGVVSFIPQRPGYGSGINGKASSGFHTANSLWANAANLNFSADNLYIALNGSYRTAQNMQTPAGKILNSQFNDASWSIKGVMKYGENQELFVNYNHFEAWNVGIPGSSSFPATATARYSAIRRNQLSGEYIFSDLSYTLRELRFKAYTQNISRDVEAKTQRQQCDTSGQYECNFGSKSYRCTLLQRLQHHDCGCRNMAARCRNISHQNKHSERLNFYLHRRSTHTKSQNVRRRDICILQKSN